jgi:hypothetical protein
MLQPEEEAPLLSTEFPVYDRKDKKTLFPFVVSIDALLIRKVL